MKKIISLIINVIISSAVFAGTYSGGSGTSGDPYQIATTDDLIELSTTSADWASHFIQTSDISFNADETQVDWDGDGSADGIGTSGFSPIGNDWEATPFTGIYNGQHHIISNIYINRTATYYVGLFGLVRNVNSEIKNVGVTNVDITGQNCVGGIVGLLFYQATINNCFSTGSVSGMVRVGGLLGENNKGNVSFCYSLADTYGVSYLGGFVGQNSNFPEIDNCFSTGDVTISSGEDHRVGGFIGENYDAVLQNCYSTGRVITVEYDDPTNKGFAGQVLGASTMSGNFWDTETSLQNTSHISDGATGKTTTEMNTQSTFTDAGWDFGSIWSISPIYNSGYPNLENQSGSTITWTGTSNSTWNNNTNWNGIVPLNQYDVIIPDTDNDPVISNGSSSDCNDLTINSNATLTINSGGSLITRGTITNNGTINIERNIPDGEWHLIASPISGATAGMFLGDYLQSWDESTGTWSDIVDESTVLNPASGYSLWGMAAKGNHTFTGTPNTGNQSTGITNQGSGDHNGFNLVGNPYPSSINWDLLNETYGAIYYWDPSEGANGDYLEWNGIGSGSRYIPPMQGFFIHTSADATFSLENSHRTHDGAGNYYKSASSINRGLILAAENVSYADEFYLVLDESAQAGFEKARDAWKIMAGGSGMPQLYSHSPDGHLAIDARPETETIQLGYTNDKAGIHTIILKEKHGITKATLEDTKTNTFHDLTKGGYEFAWEVMDSETRFKLHLKAVGIDENDNNENNNILIYTANDQLHIKGAIEGELMVIDLMGRTMVQTQLMGEQSIPVNLQSGIYIVQVNTETQTVNHKIYIN
ncbi:MAG: T9SS type A sorting domain-containing protein [Bacteroidales bacterium]|nr:T9SS type A sorting domain-containing protein [Bacteroidales bacterium]